jgi:ArsR family transcriptional regulator
MERPEVIAALAALAQANRLDIYRLLVRAGPAGLSAGSIAAAVGVAANALSFHLDRLRSAKLIAGRRRGRSIIYTARLPTMNALVGDLTATCCVNERQSAGEPPQEALYVCCAPFPSVDEGKPPSTRPG